MKGQAVFKGMPSSIECAFICFVLFVMRVYPVEKAGISLKFICTNNYVILHVA